MENETIDPTAYDNLNITIITEPITTIRLETTVPITSPSPRPTKIPMGSSMSPRLRYAEEDACILQHVKKKKKLGFESLFDVGRD